MERSGIRKHHKIKYAVTKELAKPPQDKCEAFTNTFENNYKVSKIFFKKFPTLQNNKMRNAQIDTTKTVKPNNDNGLQTRWTRTPAGNSGNRFTTPHFIKWTEKGIL
jgi:hypothetical protein